MKRTGYQCDVCGERIPKKGWWATVKRSIFRVSLRRWGIVNLSPVESGWQKRRFDVCDDCWTTLLKVVKTHVQATADETATDGGDDAGCPRCDRPSTAGLCGVCRDDADTHRRHGGS